MHFDEKRKFWIKHPEMGSARKLADHVGFEETPAGKNLKEK